MRNTSLEGRGRRARGPFRGPIEDYSTLVATIYPGVCGRDPRFRTYRARQQNEHCCYLTWLHCARLLNGEIVAHRERRPTEHQGQSQSVSRPCCHSRPAGKHSRTMFAASPTCRARRGHARRHAGAVVPGGLPPTTQGNPRGALSLGRDQGCRAAGRA